MNQNIRILQTIVRFNEFIFNFDLVGKGDGISDGNSSFMPDMYNKLNFSKFAKVSKFTSSIGFSLINNVTRLGAINAVSYMLYRI